MQSLKLVQLHKLPLISFEYKHQHVKSRKLNILYFNKSCKRDIFIFISLDVTQDILLQPAL